jgi:outer membrane protein OmpA-like peptidoglycan-associated protein
MNKLQLTLLIFSFSLLGIAQSSETSSADKLFDEFKFNLAIKEYTRVSKGNMKNPEYVYTKLADCYYNLFNYGQAIVWYEKALETSKDPEVNYRYAEMLKADAKYDAAMAQFKIFVEKKPSDPRAIKFLKNPDYINDVIENVSPFELSALEMNTEMTEFGGVIHNEKFYFISNRERKNAQKRKSDMTGEVYTNIYVGDFKNEKVTNIKEIRELNSRWYDEMLTFSPDGKTLYMSSENFNLSLGKKPKYNNLIGSKNGVYAIFKSTFERNKFWSNFEPLPFIVKEYSYTDPHLADDGKTLYFSSNMPGGFGGLDLWKVEIFEDGSYGTPVNLGDIINTSKDDRYPFVNNKEGYLYFSSNGHYGLGGLDVFKVNLKKTDARVINLGQPVNSKDNDFAFIFYPEKNIGFVSSNRTGNDDIYILKPADLVEMEFIVKDLKTNEPISMASIVIKNKKNEVVEEIYTNKEGIATFSSLPNKDYTVKISSKEFNSENLNINSGSTVNTKKTTSFQLKPLKFEEDYTAFDIEIYFDYDKSNITQQAAADLDKIVELMANNMQYKIVATTHTDIRGSKDYNKKLSHRRALSVREYFISKGIDESRIKASGAGASKPKVDCKNNCTEEQHQINRRSTFEFIKN